MAIAAGATFYGLLAIFPAIATIGIAPPGIAPERLLS